MGIHDKFITFAIIASLLLIAQSQPTHPALSIQISTKTPVVQAGSELRLTIVATNISSHDISLFRSKGEVQGEFIYTVDVRDEKGSPASRTKYGRQLAGKDVDEPKDSVQAKNADQSTGQNDEPQTTQVTVIVSSEVLLPVHPSEALTDVIIVNNIFDLSQPGKYDIQVQRVDPESKTLVRSNTITITVTPAAP